MSGKTPTQRGGRPLRTVFFDEVRSPGFWLGVFAPSLVWGLDWGRPLRGGSAVSGGAQQIFNLWVEISSVLEPTCSWKLWRDRRSTRYGPSYGCAKEGETPSFLTKTNSETISSGGKEVGSCVFLCETGLGGFNELACSAFRNSSSGGSPTCKNWPGRSGWQPITASAGDKPPSKGTADLTPSKTHGRWHSQSALAILARKESYNRRWNLSTKPLDCG